MKQLTNDQKKIDLIAKLVKDGAIDFHEAIMLMEEDVIVKTQFFPSSDQIKKWPDPLEQPYQINPFKYERKTYPLQQRNPYDLFKYGYKN
jgi:hypothetical protein